jgi:perosamine synthetase
VRKAITSRTKAIILVSANGREPIYGIAEFEKLASETGIPLIEDAAQALGSYYDDGRHVGRAGCVSTFSFSAPKIISTGQGGALITDDEKLAENIKKLKDFGRESGGNDVHGSIGFNFKFTELQAVVGLEQIKKLKNRIERKKNIYGLYQRLLNNKNEKFKLLNNDTMKTTPWFYELVTENKEKLKNYLLSENIGTRDMYPPINKQKAYQVTGTHPVSEYISEKGLWLPSMVQLTNEQIFYICEKIKHFHEK